MKLRNSKILPIVLMASAILALSGCNNSSTNSDGGLTTSFENTTSVPLPDESNTTVEITATNAADSITKVTVTVDITHTCTGDLVIGLISPLGTNVSLTSGGEFCGEDFNNTTFDDDAAESITIATDESVAITGTYSPEGSLSDFASEDANGVWQLNIFDQYGGDEGTLNSWSLTIE